MDEPKNDDKSFLKKLLTVNNNYSDIKMFSTVWFVESDNK